MVASLCGANSPFATKVYGKAKLSGSLDKIASEKTCPITKENL